ncbi:MAG: hypothetical protein GY851_22845 [bacterium]|nr:hypothetical protein [bacterium]
MIVVSRRKLAWAVPSLCLLVLSCSGPADDLVILAEKGMGRDSEYRAAFNALSRKRVERIYEYYRRPGRDNSTITMQVYLDARERVRAYERADALALHAERLERAREASAALNAPGSSLGLSAETYPRVDGSISTVPLSRLIACRQLDVPCEWIVKEWAADPVPEQANLRIRRSRYEWYVTRFTLAANTPPNRRGRIGHLINGLLALHSGAHTAYANLIGQEADLILVPRAPTEAELDLAKEKGVKLEWRPFAMDALVFVVNADNRVDDLTAEQIRSIYLGDADNWKDVGGRDAAIERFYRREDSGSQELMNALMMTPPPGASEGFYLTEDMIPMISPGVMSPPDDLMPRAKHGIGYSLHYFHHLMVASSEVRIIAVDGVRPDWDTIRNRRYPYVSEVFAVIREDLDSKHTACELRDWLLTPAGQALVAESGYVPVEVVE